MTRDDFCRAYRAARWTLRNRPLADVEIALPGDILARRIIVSCSGRRPMSLGMIASPVAAEQDPPDATVPSDTCFGHQGSKIGVGATDRALVECC